MIAGTDRRARLISHEHEWMVDRLRSLRESLDNIFLFGKADADRHALLMVLRRCRELQNALVQHMPDEEEMYQRLAEDRELAPLIERLKGEHRVMAEVLDETVGLLMRLEQSGKLPEDVPALQHRLRRFCKFMEHHIATENLHIFPHLAA